MRTAATRAPMVSVLAIEQRSVLQQLTDPAGLAVFDFDGTLAPLVQDRNAAVMRSATAILFRQVCSMYRCAIITGRAIADVQPRLADAAVVAIIGNHGMEPSLGLESCANDVAALYPQLLALFAAEPAFEIENKTYSLTVHYRRHAFRQKARLTVLRSLAQFETNMRLVEGKCVVNLVPLAAPNKGDALETLRKAFRASATLYVGDDVTDEDVFELPEATGVITVRVGQRKKSAARFFLRTQRDIDSLLRRMITLRSSEQIHENSTSSAHRDEVGSST